MRSLQIVALALVAAQTAHSYVDTSPFFMFSTSEYARPVSQNASATDQIYSILQSTSQLSTASAITSEVANTLSTCPSTHYIIISQSGVTASDYSSTSTTPTLADRLSTKRKQKGIRSSTSISDVVGGVDTDAWRRTLHSSCNLEVVDLDASTGSIPAYASFPKAVHVTMPVPGAHTTLHDLKDNDVLLATILDMVPSGDYTVLYTTSPVRAVKEPQGGYAMDSEAQELLHMEMKRGEEARVVKKVGNATLVDGGLFERYQFFTPGEFPSRLGPSPKCLKKSVMLMTACDRYLPRSPRGLHPALDSLRGHLGPVELVGHVRGV